MTNQNNAAQAADQDPLSDQFVNAVIRQHGYDSPQAVIARLWQWIGLNGSENGVTLLMYEAHKALVKLRAPVADERADVNAWLKTQRNPDDMNKAELVAAWEAWQERGRRAALASAPVAGEAVAWRVTHPRSPAPNWRDAARERPPNKHDVKQQDPDLILELAYAAPQASEAVRDAVDVALPLFPKGHARNSDVHPDSYAYDKWQLADYARAAILADRQRGADPVIGHITVKGKGRSSVDLDASHADLPEGEYVIRAALSAQPVAQNPHPKQHNDRDVAYG